MIIAKITPPVVVVNENGLFNTTTKELDYMSIIARPYIPGNDITNFEVGFGDIEEVGDEIISFNKSKTHQLKLTSDDLSSWGTDDESLFEIVSSKLGITILEYKTYNKQRPLN